MNLWNELGQIKVTISTKSILSEVPYFGGSAVLLSYSVGGSIMQLYIPQMLNKVFSLSKQ